MVEPVGNADVIEGRVRRVGVVERVEQGVEVLAGRIRLGFGHHMRFATPAGLDRLQTVASGERGDFGHVVTKELAAGIPAAAIGRFHRLDPAADAIARLEKRDGEAPVFQRMRCRETGKTAPTIATST